MTVKQRKQPIRSCVACREAADKRQLVRFVRTADGVVALDLSGRKPGRGAYLHADAQCFARAKKTGALSRALRLRLEASDYERLAEQFASSCKLEANEER
jgi:predicted RNA-binding protein YlxR (DUF448 family)